MDKHSKTIVNAQNVVVILKKCNLVVHFKTSIEYRCR